MQTGEGATVGITSRQYIFDKNGALKRVPRRIRDGLTVGQDAIPEYAGTTQRIATVIIENDRGKPVRILDAQGEIWSFDSEGRIDESLRNSVGDIFNFAFDHNPQNSKVVSLTPEIKRREFLSKSRWDIKKEELDRISADIWPAFNGASSDVEVVDGKTPKKPPLTWQAKNSLSEIAPKISLIAWQLADLKEPALKGLAFEARRTAEFGEETALWMGLANECDRLREIKARHRTGKGTWYAVIEIFFDEGPAMRRSIDVIYEKCDGKNAAIEATRKLLVENANKFNDQISIEPSTYCELEWVPPKD
ncbi:hypothetical protein QEV83_13910 [Methylocapsa sp. D3K7]|uniref:hypothetical protein n=1 Tax=Methylocapsa sp. D3K7 TaxID=3041435 RepID=UPI00244ECB66|nr:hypothetical protein [Methylocapsa sp. D3K7]WGJ13771.1 hypothetical protein QEV83_13910 [Methylocapsa sp. D3K7]